MIDPSVTLFEGEAGIEVGGVSLVVRESPGRAGLPLVVVLPGAVHMARIASGDPTAAPSDFLTHWLEQAGYPTLAVSYPLETQTPSFAHVDPGLGLARFARAVAAHTADVVTRCGLPERVVVAAWSAGANIAPRLAAACADRGLTLQPFIALAGTPPLPNLVLGSRHAARTHFAQPDAMTPSGLLSHRAIRSFDDELDALDAAYGRAVLDHDAYERQYLGNMPLNLFPGLDARLEAGALRIGHAGPLSESRGAEWSEYPIVAAIAPTARLDARHAVTDRANWSMVTANVLHARHVAGRDLTALSPSGWAEMRDAIADGAADAYRRVEGGHMFFVGETGAAATATAIGELVAMADELDATLRRLAPDS